MVSGAAAAQQDAMIQELEKQLEEADRQGVTGPEIDQLRQMLQQIKADEAAANEETPSSVSASEQDDGATDAMADEGAGGNDLLAYTSPEGERKSLNVDKSQRARFAAMYANEYRDPAVADFRYSLRADGSAVLEHRVCENCTHDLSGEGASREWQVEYEAVEWAPMTTDSGAPLTRSVRDMAGKTHEARVLVVSLEQGGVMTLDHYTDSARAALAGPYGVPRYEQ